MFPTTVRYSLAMVALTLLSVPLMAADEGAVGQKAVTPGKTYVVLVGINNYADKQIKPRLHAEADAQAFFDLFTDKQYLGVPRPQVQLLLGTPDAGRGSEPATRENVLKALTHVAKVAEPQDLVVYGFFGQGGPLGDTGDRTCYFVSDSTFKGRAKDAVAAAEIQDALKPLKATRFCVFLDVNFKGFVPDKGLADVSLGQTPYKEFLGDDGTEEHAALPGRVLFLATNGLSQGIDLEKHGLFAETALTALKGAADGWDDKKKVPNKPDGTVTVDELAGYLDKEVPLLATKFGKTKEEKEQGHFVLGTRDSHFGLTQNPAETAAVAKRLADFETMVKNGKIPPAFAEQGRELLARMPRLDAQRKLRAAYQALADGKTDLATFEKTQAEIVKETKLAPEDAPQFADKVMDAIKIVRENHVKSVKSGQLVEWGIKGLYRRTEEKLPADLEAKLKNSATLQEKDLTRLLADARVHLGKREDLDDQKDLDITLKRMLSNLDPYTTYISKDEKQRFDSDTRGNFTGIGIQIRKDATTDQLLVVTPIMDSPAYKSGLQAGDVITKIIRTVDSEGNRLDKPETIPTKGMSVNDAVKKILGQPNTQVTLVVSRDGQEKEFVVTRGRIDTESVLGYRREGDANSWNYWLDEKNRIVYIRLTSFQENSGRDMRRLMDRLTKEPGGVKGVILDLRFNPGGYLTTAVQITDLFIDDGKIVTIRPRVGAEDVHHGRTDDIRNLLNFPMVCMVNGYSASGSEIVSAALQDHGRALILGERSYGKGSVQHTQKWGDGLLKYTMASFWRPSDKNLNKSSTAGKDDDEWGVTPDKLVPLTRKERDDLGEAQRDSEIILPPGKKREKSDFQDKQLNAALEYIRDMIKTSDKVSK